MSADLTFDPTTDPSWLDYLNPLVGQLVSTATAYADTWTRSDRVWESVLNTTSYLASEFVM